MKYSLSLSEMEESFKTLLFFQFLIMIVVACCLFASSNGTATVKYLNGIEHCYVSDFDFDESFRLIEDSKKNIILADKVSFWLFWIVSPLINLIYFCFFVYNKYILKK